MLKEALEYLKKEFRTTEIEEINGKKFSTNPLYDVPENRRERLYVNSLTGLIDFIKDDFDRDSRLLINVEDESRVTVKTLLDDSRERESVIIAEAYVPQKELNLHIELEEFNIQLQSQFVENEDREKILKLISSINSNTVKTTHDNGMTQKVEVKQGVTGVEEADVPNPVHLKPFRTFTEIAQPESPFVLRLREHYDRLQAGLFEADGGAWKNEARLSIKEYLENELTDALADDRILIIG